MLRTFLLLTFFISFNAAASNSACVINRTDEALEFTLASTAGTSRFVVDPASSLCSGRLEDDADLETTFCPAMVLRPWEWVEVSKDAAGNIRCDKNFEEKRLNDSYFSLDIENKLPQWVSGTTQPDSNCGVWEPGSLTVNSRSRTSMRLFINSSGSCAFEDTIGIMRFKHPVIDEFMTLVCSRKVHGNMVCRSPTYYRYLIFDITRPEQGNMLLTFIRTVR